jgi:hypothetical protein
MNGKKVLLKFIALLINILLVACANDARATDYSKPEHWLNIPAVIDKKVDVFYLYPTAWKKVNKDDPNIDEIDNPLMLKLV